MSVIIDEIHMVNRAMARAGTGAVTSLDDDVPGGSAAGLIYAGVTEFLLGVYPFSFTFQWKQLARIANAAPFTGFDYLFKLPGDRLEQPKQYSSDMTQADCRYTDLVLNGDRVHANVDELFARTQILVAPVEWSATFREAHTLYLAAEFAGAMPALEKKAMRLRQDAVGTTSENYRGGALGVAIRADAQNTPPRKLIVGSNPLLASWQSAEG